MFRISEDGTPVGDGKGEKLQIDLSKEEIKPEILEKAKGKKAGDSFSFTFDEERKLKIKRVKKRMLRKHIIIKHQLKLLKKLPCPNLNEELIKKATKDKISNEN